MVIEKKILTFYYAPTSRPEGPRRCPDRRNAGGALVFIYLLQVRGCSLMMSCTEGGRGVWQKVIFDDVEGRGGQVKSNFS